ncbi:MAG TPA: hypothetical protein VG983_03330, partial [Caulobacterales bacterium]|nr:hypothetical protein [Caulobacterales bacterium]
RYLPDLANLAGILGAVHLEGAEEEGRSRNLVVAFLGEEPRILAADLRRRLLERSPPPGLAREFGGCFNVITPLRYDFLPS